MENVIQKVIIIAWRSSENFLYRQDVNVSICNDVIQRKRLISVNYFVFTDAPPPAIVYRRPFMKPEAHRDTTNSAR